MKIVICIVTYNRLDSLKRLLDSLYNAKYNTKNRYDLIISIDYSGKDEVYKFCSKLKWIYGNLKIINHQVNLGLKRHVLECGNHVFDYEGLIMLEDDIIVSSAYTNYIEQMIPLCNSKQIGGVSLYSYQYNEFMHFRPFSPMKNENDIYLMKIPSSWGQFWTKEQWINFTFWLDRFDDSTVFNVPNAVNNWGERSWKKLFSFYMVECNKYFIFPYYGYSTNMSDVGEHNISTSNVMQSPLINQETNLHFDESFNEFIRYDQYMENENIENDFEETTIDIYGSKNKYKKYVISTKKMDYKILKQWGLSIKPFELNIIKNIPGNSIFLYDTTKKEKNHRYINDEFMSYFPYTKYIVKNYMVHSIKKIAFRYIKSR